MKSGIYIHLPLCVAKCEYCDFYSVPLREGLKEAYLEALGREIAGRLPSWPGSFDTVYLGGGTPSLLQPDQIDQLLQWLHEHADIDAEAEITMEVNSRECSEAYLRHCGEAGVNRFSLGLQSFDAEALAFIGRRAGPLSLDALKQCSQGLQNWSADLIGGIPGRTLSDEEKERNDLIDCMPRHISFYQLTLEEGTPLHQRLLLGDDDESHQRESFRAGRAALRKAGYLHYEISNYALPGFQSRHNLKYWHLEPWIGLGAGAHSFDGLSIFHNENDIDSYIKGDRQERTDGKAGWVEFLLSGLRLREGVNMDDGQGRFGKFPEEGSHALNTLLQENMLSLERGRLSLSEEGLLWADSVLYRLCEPLL